MGDGKPQHFGLAGPVCADETRERSARHVLGGNAIDLHASARPARSDSAGGSLDAVEEAEVIDVEFVEHKRPSGLGRVLLAGVDLWTTSALYAVADSVDSLFEE